jgi:phytoene dehydrogenase-like protein
MSATIRERAARACYDAVVVGAGPNGLAAAITLARAGAAVLLVEGQQTLGGGARSLALTLPGFVHDLGAAIHPLGLGSPFFRLLPLEEYGLEWVQPAAPLAHPLDDGTAVLLERSVRATAAGLGRDGAAYRRLLEPLVADWELVLPGLLGPLRPRTLRHPVALARFGLPALLPASALARGLFRDERARALFGGIAAHQIIPLERAATAAAGLVLATLAHAVGWPLPRGGSQRLADALAAHLRALGGEIIAGVPVAALGDLPPARRVLFDLSPRQVLAIAGAHLPAAYRRALGRFRPGQGVFKLDWALDGPIPWRDPACARAATVHVAGPLPEIAAGERAVWQGRAPERPYVLVVQPTLFDATRAPAGKHTAWAYCHIPYGATCDMTARMEAQIERFAPGFRDRILARSALGPAGLEARNANHRGGDINGGVQDLRQLFTRPLPRLVPYAMPGRRLYFCSSSTPPGAGVHGLCGYSAARAALRDLA